jgi:hypothetical protein
MVLIREELCREWVCREVCQEVCQEVCRVERTTRGSSSEAGRSSPHSSSHSSLRSFSHSSASTTSTTIFSDFKGRGNGKGGQISIWRTVPLSLSEPCLYCFINLFERILQKLIKLTGGLHIFFEFRYCRKLPKGFIKLSHP